MSVSNAHVKPNFVCPMLQLQILELIQTNGLLYIKIGQVIGAMEFFVPIEYHEQLKVCENEAPTSGMDEVVRCVFWLDMRPVSS